MPHPIPSADLPPLERLRAIMHLLRSPGGCPWDAEQTHETLVKHGIEEAYEVADAVASGETDAIVDELGDLLLQPVFHAEIASETGRFDFDDITTAISEKLIRRHPHVFGEAVAATPGAVLTQWEEIKAMEKAGEESGRVESTSQQGQVEPASPAKARFLTKANEGLPALMAAQKIQKKVAKIGFDWPDITPVVAKIHEELEEVEEALSRNSEEDVAEEIGDLLFAVVNLARRRNLDSELLLHQTNRKFVDRFQSVEEGLKAAGSSLEEASLEEMDAEWDRAKTKQKKTG